MAALQSLAFIAEPDGGVHEHPAVNRGMNSVRAILQARTTPRLPDASGAVASCNNWQNKGEPIPKG
jgi:hypothetical protein